MTEDEAECQVLAARQREFAGEGRARVDGAAAAPAQAGGQHQLAQRVEKFAAVAGPLRASCRTRQGQKGRAAAKTIATFTLLGKHGHPLGAVPGVKRAPVAPGFTHLPLDHGDSTQPPPGAAFVQPHAHLDHLDRLMQVGKKRGLQQQAGVPALEHRITLAMAHAPAAVGRGQQRGCQRKHFAAVQVLQQPVFKRGVAHGVVRPGGDLVHAAVAGPGVATTGFRHLETKGRIADDVDPGPGKALAASQLEPVLAAGGIEAARGKPVCHGRRVAGQRGWRHGTGPLRQPAFAQGRDLHFQRPPVGVEHHPCQPGQRTFFTGRHFLLAQQEKARSRRCGFIARETVLHRLCETVAQRQDVALQRHEVGVDFAVDHHHVDRQPAEGPPGLGAQQCMHQRQAAG